MGENRNRHPVAGVLDGYGAEPAVGIRVQQDVLIVPNARCRAPFYSNAILRGRVAEPAQFGLQFTDAGLGL